MRYQRPAWSCAVTRTFVTKWRRNPEIVGTVLTVLLGTAVQFALVLGVVLGHDLLSVYVPHG